MGVGGHRDAPTALHSGMIGNLCTGGWVGSGACLDGCGNSRPHRSSILGPSSPQQVAKPTALILYVLLTVHLDISM